MWLNHNVHEQLDVHQACVTACKNKQKNKNKNKKTKQQQQQQQQLTPGPSGKIEEQNIVDSYTSKYST